ncbi:MAG: AraC family transcriptional regulator [Pseudohongiella sp.]|nr:AraC family transcriptional regulator [Pseudohongiella sp.]
MRNIATGFDSLMVAGKIPACKIGLILGGDPGEIAALMDLASLPLIVLVDLLFRTMVMGQLVLLGALLLKEPGTPVTRLLLACGISVAALIVLTAPIPDQHYGLLRNVLLVLTDAFSLLFWLLIRYLFEDDFSIGPTSAVKKALFTLLMLVYLYALGVRAGITPIHDLIHWVGLFLIVHTVYIAIRGYANDLLDARRRARIVLVLVIGLYSTVLVVFELIDERFRNAALYGLVNAGILLIAITFGIGRVFSLRFTSGVVHDGTHQTDESSNDRQDNTAKNHEAVVLTRTLQDPVLSELKHALDSFIAQKCYQQNGLTITALAKQLDCPEHKLRRLINQTMGHRNFNSFLNELRVNDACQLLGDANQNVLPVLSIALSLGYDSIGPFNRAFKAQTGLTPGDYRRTVQNRC